MPRIKDLAPITPTTGDFIAVDQADSGGVTGRVPLGLANGVPLLNALGALASSEGYLNRGNVSSPIDWNTITETGIYTVFNEAFASGSANTPPATYTYGHLLVLHAGGVITQVYIPHVNDPGIYWRQAWLINWSWSSWNRTGTQYGANSNGAYVRFADGTQICWSSHPDSSFGPTTVGNDTNYRFRIKPWTFPAAFTAAPVVLVDGDILGSRVEVFGARNISSTGCTLEAGQYNTTSVTVETCNSLAIGRWR